MSGRVGVEKRKGWSNKPSARTVWRCPKCGDQTLQGAKGGTCGPCLVRRRVDVRLVEATRERIILGEETVADPRFLADEGSR